MHTSFPQTLDAETESKLHALEARLAQSGSLMVAYSGGVDSAYLAATAHRVLGSRMLAVLADSPSLARRDFDEARAFVCYFRSPSKGTLSTAIAAIRSGEASASE